MAISNSSFSLFLFALKDNVFRVTLLFTVDFFLYSVILLSVTSFFFFSYVLFKSRALYLVHDVLFDSFGCLLVILLYGVDNIKVVFMIGLYLLGLNILVSMHETLCEKKKIDKETETFFFHLLGFYGLFLLLVFYFNTSKDIILPAVLLYYVVLKKSLRYNLFYKDVRKEQQCQEATLFIVGNSYKQVTFDTVFEQIKANIKRYDTYSLILKGLFLVAIFIYYIN